MDDELEGKGKRGSKNCGKVRARNRKCLERIKKPECVFLPFILLSTRQMVALPIRPSSRASKRVNKEERARRKAMTNSKERMRGAENNQQGILAGRRD